MAEDKSCSSSSLSLDRESVDASTEFEQAMKKEEPVKINTSGLNLMNPMTTSPDLDGDSDLDEVLAESTQIIVGSRMKVKPEFFVTSVDENDKGEAGIGEMHSISDAGRMLYDTRPPSRNQVIGSTPEYLEMLKVSAEIQSEVEKPLVPIFKIEHTLKPCYLYWNYPRAVVDYDMIERWMVSIIPSKAVKKLICREGRDETLVTGDNVMINYYMYVEGSPYCVESNQRRGKPHCLVLGRKCGGIPVIDLGTLSMRVREISAFLATPGYGYGRLGVVGNPWIPPNKRVLCIIQVLNRLPSPPESFSIINLAPAERKLIRFGEIYEFAVQRQLDGKKALTNGKIARALRKYFQALTCLDDAIATEATQLQAQHELLFVLYANLIICGIHTCQTSLVIDFSQKCLALPLQEKTKIDVYLQRVNAFYQARDLLRAKQNAEKALELIENGAEGESNASKFASQIDCELTEDEQSDGGSAISDSRSSTTTMYSACAEQSTDEVDEDYEEAFQDEK